MAATFIDLADGRALRIAATESSKDRARALYPEIENKNQQQMQAYRAMPDAELFTEEWVQVALPAKEFPGYKGERVACSRCGEGVSYERWVEHAGEKLCRGCAAPEARYYQPLARATGQVGEAEAVEVPRCACP